MRQRGAKEKGEKTMPNVCLRNPVNGQIGLLIGVLWSSQSLAHLLTIQQEKNYCDKNGRLAKL